jgi:hypothetical protein
MPGPEIALEVKKAEWGPEQLAAIPAVEVSDRIHLQLTVLRHCLARWVAIQFVPYPICELLVLEPCRKHLALPQEIGKVDTGIKRSVLDVTKQAHDILLRLGDCPCVGAQAVVSMTRF